MFVKKKMKVFKDRFCLITQNVDDQYLSLSSFMVERGMRVLLGFIIL